MKHTPTPWAQDKYGSVQVNRETVVVDGFALSCGPSNPVAVANKEFIVRACNSHHQLVAMVEEMLEGYSMGRCKKARELLASIAVAGEQS